VTRSLTLNLGLRYELSPPPVDVNDAIANYDMDTDPANPHLVLAGSEGSDRASRALQGINYKQFAPRAGFAYSLPGDRTVVRGGFGIFYANLITLGGMQSMEINPPNHVRINQSTSAASPSIFLSQGFADDALSPASARNVTLVSYDRSSNTPTAYQWNLNVQRELPGQVVVEIGYNSNRFVNDWRQIDGNPAPPGPGDINARREFTSAVVPGTDDVISLSNVVRIQKDGWSRYRALQTKVEKRYSKGCRCSPRTPGRARLAFGNFFQDANNLDAEIAVADTDRTHYFRRQRRVGPAVRSRPRDRQHLGRCGQRRARRLEPEPDRHGCVWRAAEPHGERQPGQHRPERPPQRGRRLGAGEPDAGTVVQHRRVRRQRPLHVRQRAAEPAARPGSVNLDVVLRKSFRLATASAPTCASNRSTPPTRRARQPEHAGGQRQLRPYLVGRRGAQQPGRAETVFLRAA
jgi:hypothetical protein